jgi:hypothetical protein
MGTSMRRKSAQIIKSLTIRPKETPPTQLPVTIAAEKAMMKDEREACS